MGFEEESSTISTPIQKKNIEYEHDHEYERRRIEYEYEYEWG